MPNGFFLQLLLVWSSLWTFFALWGVLRGAGAALLRGEVSTFVKGTTSIGLVFSGILLSTAQRLERLYQGYPVASLSLPLSTAAFICFATGAHLACSVGLPPILWRGRPWAWRIYATGALALLATEALR